MPLILVTHLVTPSVFQVEAGSQYDATLTVWEVKINAPLYIGVDLGSILESAASLCCIIL